MIEINGDDEVEGSHQIIRIWKNFSGNIFQMDNPVFQILKHPWPPSNKEIQTSGDGLEQGAVGGLGDQAQGPGDNGVVLRSGQFEASGLFLKNSP